VLRAGRLQQLGTPTDLWRSPRTAFVASFLGLSPVLEVEASATSVTTPWGTVPRAAVSDAGAGNGRIPAVVLADALRLRQDQRPPDGEELTTTGTVLAQRFQGDHLRVTVAPTNGPELSVPLRRSTPVAIGTEVVVGIEVAGLHLLAPDPMATA
jgi:ABC-type Fe3+/spermidine/putrescine transport system ATPase subunit